MNEVGRALGSDFRVRRYLGHSFFLTNIELTSAARSVRLETVRYLSTCNGSNLNSIDSIRNLRFSRSSTFGVSRRLSYVPVHFECVVGGWFIGALWAVIGKHGVRVAFQPTDQPR